MDKTPMTERVEHINELRKWWAYWIEAIEDRKGCDCGECLRLLQWTKLP